ncbi:MULTISPECIES: 3-methyl-2-oxobutanoate dehydrogenase subunit VorB [Paraclostridium]|jgi:2-oxoglutarate ferredoxin oxidoreductase subunit alpha|uniref:Thiamine pyrophosphate enzyme, N-terminal TPP binding domain protein n=2 Tax=Paraclostridium bifermentans TaxID=1490 RepID=T4VWF2_PARBF|nr:MULTISPECIES: 3-methyl-2-oxobutanoate dehydrogenase subunit VorB [Paraclostridium]MDU7904997.1 3-methyl-2-oxobutanoate dehydrogenase subunit VorB [Peptostreptococcaceae bacterium]MDV8113696.1 3-methyl-2-oxobutanoate dehydrogenase subunit VorB [Bacillus sp. BAU-SS-2023]RDC51075.1 3-methyl-2-oxobutanoate dehydrogenase subunit VorB [Acinetobacter sp. RIT592]EQK45455.1 thiamine pyrophosphate enzyme, N-terminal TPP binding domain protein [[Clostridium] bifermentans ATCC 638] [Paraclostridium bife
MAKILMKGNEAIGKAAMEAGCKYFFGYPITPQNELPEYMSRELPKNGGAFVQAESEVSAINMVYGAAGAGARVMTSSSSPGIALKQEGITYAAGAELPCVVVNIMRGGPGLGGIQPSQSDYFMSTRGGGNGDYRTPVYAPATVQEAVDMVMEAFEVADFYRTPVMVVGDGMIGQMMEPVEFNKPKTRELAPKTWASVGTKMERKPNIINSLYLDPKSLEDHCINLDAKYKEIEKNETAYEMYKTEDAEIVFVAYGTTSRIVKNTIESLREEGIKAGLIRPKTLWPFPFEAFNQIPEAKNLLTVEMSTGQMVEDVRLAIEGRLPVHFYGRTGGMIPSPAEIAAKAKEIVEQSQQVAMGGAR